MTLRLVPEDKQRKLGGKQNSEEGNAAGFGVRKVYQ